MAVNFKWAHVAIAQKIKEKTEDSGVELSSSMLETVKSNMGKIDLVLDVRQLTCHREELRSKRMELELERAGLGTARALGPDARRTFYLPSQTER